MARVTVEDCLNNVENRFALVHATVQRAKQLFKNSTPLIKCKNKEVVCSLREIADNKVRLVPTALETPIKKGRRKN